MRNSEQKHSAPLPKRKHLRRLDRILIQGAPVYFITVCVKERRPLLADPLVASVLTDAWRYSYEGHGWMVGRYVIMPDHVHFFAAPAPDDAKTLSLFMGCWKRSTSIRIRALQAAGQRRLPRPTNESFAWQKEFFDHLLRNDESYREKWEYIRQNPCRSGLVSDPGDWPYQGDIHVL